jgi:hypothetical protein
VSTTRLPRFLRIVHGQRPAAAKTFMFAAVECNRALRAYLTIQGRPWPLLMALATMLVLGRLNA